ncbi:SDR family NAD(P)-dependent oxidoreductase [Kitasatospora sp. NPDC017646]|uniref:SDR family oxidoreductase n=1 Tax=Kitasatospora sp. NPDC017646 TaxID=3364024 RepID=UPI003792EB74
MSDALTDVLAALPGPLAGEVLAAGHGRGHGPVREADCAAWESQLRVNLLAPMILTRRLLPELDATDGDLVLVGSLFGTRPSPGYAAYAATKHGLAGFVRSLAEEDRSADGCRICLISSGATNTEFASVLAGAATPRVHQVTDWPYHPLLGEDVAAAAEWEMSRPGHARVAQLPIDPTDARTERSRRPGAGRPPEEAARGHVRRPAWRRCRTAPPARRRSGVPSTAPSLAGFPRGRPQAATPAAPSGGGRAPS